MNHWRDQFLEMSLDGRKKYVEMVQKCFVGDRLETLPVIYDGIAPRHSKSDIINFAIRHSVVTFEEMESAIKAHPEEDPPKMQHLLYLFGSWMDFRNELRKDQRYWAWAAKFKDIDLIQYVSKMNVSSQEDYLKKRAKLGNECLPSVPELINRFGSWRLFQLLVYSCSVDWHLRRYFIASLEAGRPLTLKECAVKKIDIQFLKEVLSEKLMLSILSKWESLYRGNSKEKKIHGGFENALFKKNKKIRRAPHHRKDLQNMPLIKEEDE